MRSWRRADTRTPRRGRGDDGAVLMEFAIIAPVLFVILFGIIEFGWAFFQNLDVRHGAREGARLAAVNYKATADPNSDDQLDQIIAAACERMDSGDDVEVRFHRPGTNQIGQVIRVHVEKPLDTLTGFLDFALGGRTLKSDVEIRVEQTANWTNMGAADLEACP